jgi:hypothetical protein
VLRLTRKGRAIARRRVLGHFAEPALEDQPLDYVVQPGSCLPLFAKLGSHRRSEIQATLASNAKEQIGEACHPRLLTLVRDGARAASGELATLKVSQAQIKPYRRQGPHASGAL